MVLAPQSTFYFPFNHPLSAPLEALNIHFNLNLIMAKTLSKMIRHYRMKKTILLLFFVVGIGILTAFQLQEERPQLSYAEILLRKDIPPKDNTRYDLENPFLEPPENLVRVYWKARPIIPAAPAVYNTSNLLLETYENEAPLSAETK